MMRAYNSKIYLIFSFQTVYTKQGVKRLTSKIAVLEFRTYRQERHEDWGECQ